MPDRVFSQDPVYRIPQGFRVFAIGDVHGCLDLLKKMQDAIAGDLIDNPPEAAHIVYLGDYIDRGPDSRGVIEYLIERQARGDGIAKTFLLGNHELGLFEFLDDPLKEDWLKWGGREAVESYGIAVPPVLLPSEAERLCRDLRAVLPESHLSFLRSLQTHTVIGDYVFAHAGIDPRKTLAGQDVSDFTFIREPFLSWPHAMPMRVVHGHTITPQPEVLSHRIGVDTGAYKGGGLSCAVLEGDSVRFLRVG